MNKIAVAFAAASLMALTACGGEPAEEANMASNEVMMNDMDANMMDDGANMMANDMNAMNSMDNGMENAGVANAM